MKLNLDSIPDWAGTAIVGAGVSLVGFAVMWGSLKSEVSAQVTAQSADASDIKQLIATQAGLAATVNALAVDQKQLHIDFLAFMDAYGMDRNNSTILHRHTRTP